MNNKTMKKAFIDQIILWIVLFTIFVSFLFFIIDYSNAIKVKDNTDAIADYIARMIALDKTNAEIVTGANKIKESYFADIQEDEIVCNIDASISNYEVIMNVKTTLTNGFLNAGANNVHSKTVVFNESSEFQKECTLTLSFN
jgi:Flp pilus assembly protein TadG